MELELGEHGGASLKLGKYYDQLNHFENAFSTMQSNYNIFLLEHDFY